jgi:hypothetical protein
MAITEHDVEVLELDYLEKRLTWKRAEDEYRLAHEKLLAARRVFLLEKFNGEEPETLMSEGKEKGDDDASRNEGSKTPAN